MALIESGTGKIESLNSKGLGEFKSPSGRKLSIPYSLPGEVIEYELHGYRNKSNTSLIKHIQTSPERQNPKCQYFSKCGGCLMQHMSSETYLNTKMLSITENLKKYNINTTIQPITEISESKRRRANFDFITNGSSSKMGFHKYHFNEIIDIEECPALEKDLSDIIPSIKDTLSELFTERNKANVYITMAHNGVDLLVRLKNLIDIQRESTELLDSLAKKHNFCKIKLTHKKTTLYQYLVEEPYIILGGASVNIHPDGFLQATKDSDIVLADLVKKYISPNQGEVIADLFAGRGTLSIPLSHEAKTHSFESDKRAISSLDEAVKNNNLNISIVNRDLYLAPLFAHELDKFDKVVINPPRSGAEEQAKELASSEVSKICYVSCNPETFARDAKILMDSGYSLEEITPVDQFKWNPHLELVGLFAKKS